MGYPTWDHCITSDPGRYSHAIHDNIDPKYRYWLTSIVGMFGTGGYADGISVMDEFSVQQIFALGVQGNLIHSCVFLLPSVEWSLTFMDRTMYVVFDKPSIHKARRRRFRNIVYWQQNDDYRPPLYSFPLNYIKTRLFEDLKDPSILYAAGDIRMDGQKSMVDWIKHYHELKDRLRGSTRIVELLKQTPSSESDDEMIHIVAKHLRMYAAKDPAERKTANHTFIEPICQLLQKKPEHMKLFKTVMELLVTDWTQSDTVLSLVSDCIDLTKLKDDTNVPTPEYQVLFQTLVDIRLQLALYKLHDLTRSFALWLRHRKKLLSYRSKYPETAGSQYGTDLDTKEREYQLEIQKLCIQNNGDMPIVLRANKGIKNIQEKKLNKLNNISNKEDVVDKVEPSNFYYLEKWIKSENIIKQKLIRILQIYDGSSGLPENLASLNGNSVIYSEIKKPESLDDIPEPTLPKLRVLSKQVRDAFLTEKVDAISPEDYVRSYMESRSMVTSDELQQISQVDGSWGIPALSTLGRAVRGFVSGWW